MRTANAWTDNGDPSAIASIVHERPEGTLARNRWLWSGNCILQIKALLLRSAVDLGGTGCARGSWRWAMHSWSRLPIARSGDDAYGFLRRCYSLMVPSVQFADPQFESNSERVDGSGYLPLVDLP